jgi:hypothetical protein
MSKKILSLVLALIIVPGIFAAPAPAETAEPQSGGNSLPGRWVCDYGITKTGVYFFDDDGTFILASIYKYTSNVISAVEHCKGNYQVSGGTMEFTNMYRYSNDLAGWRDVPMNEIDGEALAQKVLDIQKIIKTGTRAEVEELINPDNPYYNRKSNQGWKPFASRSGKIEFIDANHMKTNIMGSMDEYERVN